MVGGCRSFWRGNWDEGVAEGFGCVTVTIRAFNMAVGGGFVGMGVAGCGLLGVASIASGIGIGLRGGFCFGFCSFAGAADLACVTVTAAFDAG